MRLFILKFSLFIISILILLGIITSITDAGLKKSGYFHYNEWNLLYQSKINSDILVMGNSRAYHHINPAIIDSSLHTNSFNLGMDASQFDLQYTRFMAYMKTNKQPRIILQNIDEWTLSKSSLYIREQYIPYYNDSSLLNTITNMNVLPSEYFIYPLKYMGSDRNCWKVGFLEYFNIKHFNNNKFKGYLPDTIRFHSKLIDKESHAFKLSVDKNTEKLFEEFLSLCREKNIKVICFYAPLYKDGYVKSNHEETIRHYQNILSKYNVPILDFAQTEFSDKKIYFRNLSHLREEGANIFTTRLVEKIDSIFPTSSH